MRERERVRERLEGEEGAIRLSLLSETGTRVTDISNASIIYGIPSAWSDRTREFRV